MRTMLTSFTLVFALSGCAGPVIRVFVPNYPDFPRYPLGYAQTECSYVADSRGKDQNGTYTVHVDSMKVTEGYADDCRPPSAAKKK